MRRWLVLALSIALVAGLWPIAYTVAQSIFGDAGLNGGPGLTRPDGEAPPNDAPSASFTVSIPDSIVADFTDTSTDAQGDSTITSWSWVFGDGTTSTSQSPEKTYDYYGGDRIINLTVSDERGAQDTAQDTVYVRPGWINSSLEIITSDSLSYTFLGSAFVPDGWNAEVDQYISVRPGSNYENDVFSTQHEVTLPAGLDSVVVRHVAGIDYGGEQGGEVSELTDYWIPVADPPSEGPPNVAPTASFTTADADGDSLDFEFTDTSTDSDGTVVAWNWDFGDGGSSSSQNPVHEYGLFDGSRTVTLIATDNDGAADTTSASVEIARPPSGTPAITSVVGTVDHGEILTINGSGFGSGPTMLYFENFDDGTDGNVIAAGGNTADVGTTTTDAEVTSAGSFRPVYDTGQSVAGGVSGQIQTVSGTYTGGIQNIDADWADEAGDGEEVLVSHWARTNGTPEQWKSLWLLRDFDNASDDIVVWTVNGGWFRIEGSGVYQETVSIPTPINSWSYVEFWATVGNDGNSPWSLHVANESNTYGVTESNTTADEQCCLTNPTSKWWNSHWNSRTHRPKSNLYWHDQVYVAKGNAKARVYLADASTLEASNWPILQRPLTWSASQITVDAQVRSGEDGNTWYVIVVAADGTVSASESVTVGSAGGNADPTVDTFNFSLGDSLEAITLGRVIATDDSAVDSLRFTPWVGSYTRGIAYSGDASDTIVVDYTSQQVTENTTVTATVVAVDDSSATSAQSQQSITVKASNPSNSAPSAALAVTDSASVDAVVLDRSSSTDSDGTIDTTRWTPWSGSWTRVANQDTIVVDYTSQQSTGDVVVEPKVVVIDNDSAADSTTTFYTIPGTGGGSSLPDSVVAGSEAWDYTTDADWAQSGTFAVMTDVGSYLQGASNSTNTGIVYTDFDAFETNDEAWVRLTVGDPTGGTPGYVHIHMHDDGNGNFERFGWDLSLGSNNGWWTITNSGFNDGKNQSINGNIPSSAGDTITLTWDGTNYRMYVNATLHDTIAGTGTARVSLPTADWSVGFGAYHTSSEAAHTQITKVEFGNDISADLGPAYQP